MNARDMLLALGTPQPITTMAIPYLWFLPGAVDPDAQGVMEIVKAAQRGLRKIGFPVLESGVMDRPTAAAMDQLFPPRGTWTSTSWIVVLDRIHRLMRSGKKFSSTPPPGRVAMQGLGAFYGYGPLPGRMVGLPPGPLGLGDFVMTSGVAKPKDLVTLGVFQGLQRAANAGLKVLGLKTIKVDGSIGGGTVAAVKAVGFPFSGVDALARSAATVANGIATKFGVTVNLTADPASARGGGAGLLPGGVAEAGMGPGGPGLWDKIQQLPGGKFLPFIALGVGAAWFAVQQRKKRAS
jgi:hypothetical protein